MSLIQQIIAKSIGKRLDANLEKYHISKTKVIAVLALAVPFIPKVSEALGYPFEMPKEVYEILAALGLWSMRDALAEPSSNAKPKE